MCPQNKGSCTAAVFYYRKKKPTTFFFVTVLWLGRTNYKEKEAQRKIKLEKIKGTANPADRGTKFCPRIGFIAAHRCDAM